MELILNVDKKGRILIPSEIRARLGIKNAVNVRVENGKLIIEPIRDPIDFLTSSVIRGTTDVELQINELRKAAFKKAMEKVDERWL
mgnify:CR=1 FL=1